MGHDHTNTVYIDGDVLPYQIGFSTQKSVYMVDVEGQHSVAPLFVTRSKVRVNKYLKIAPDLLVTKLFFTEEPIQVINTLKLHLSNIVKASKCATFKVVLSGRDNFREEIATIQPYKGNREGMEKPVHFDLIRDWLLDKQYTIVSENEEADDVISKAMMQGYVGASPDKDLNNTPGLHYNFRTGSTYTVSDEEAENNFYAQMLTGDSADHIPGIKGIGPKTAEKILGRCKSLIEKEQAILKEYTKIYEDPIKAMTEVGQLLWMRRTDNEMWRPSIG